jgi:conserved oligomeric Golgi complex subunit 1
MDTNLEYAYKALHQKIIALLSTHKQSGHAGPIAIFILRVLRDIRAALPKRPDLKSFGLSIIPDLHAILAISVSSTPISSLATSITARKRVVGRALWEGTPELPVHPSPAAFKFLHSLTSSMMSAGSDLWSFAAVGALKRHLRQELEREWSLVLDSMNKEGEVQVNGHNSDGPEVEANDTEPEASADAHVDGTIKSVEEDLKIRHQEIHIQSLFDVYLLQHALVLPSSKTSVNITSPSDDGLLKLEESLKPRIELSNAEVQRLQCGAQEYWKRMGLLFGLLV